MTFQSTSAFVISGVVLAGVGFLFTQRRVPPNRWVGFRIRATLSNESIWYSVHERSGHDLLIAGVAVVVAALAAPALFPRWPAEFRTLLVAAVLVVGLATTTRRALRHARTLGRP